MESWKNGRKGGMGGGEKERRQGEKGYRQRRGKEGVATSVFYPHILLRFSPVLIAIVGGGSGYGAMRFAIAIEDLWMEGVLEGKQGADSALLSHQDLEAKGYAE